MFLSNEEFKILISDVEYLIFKYLSSNSDEKMYYLKRINYYGRIMFFLAGLWAKINNPSIIDGFKKIYRTLEKDKMNGYTYRTPPTVDAGISIIESVILDE